jgi:hypothetical protein
LNLERKHQVIIHSHLENFDPMRQSVDDAARECMDCIARAEGQQSFGSTNAELYGWMLRAAPEFSTLHGNILERFEGVAGERLLLQLKRKLDKPVLRSCRTECLAAG